MITTLELVYQYRRLVGRCSTGAGLDFEEIDTLANIEALFAPHDPRGELASEAVELGGSLKRQVFHDPVQVVRLGPAGCVCRQAPFADEGELVELVIDDPERAMSYRFKATISRLDDDGDDYLLVMKFIGVPVLVRYGSFPIEPMENAQPSQIAA